MINLKCRLKKFDFDEQGYKIKAQQALDALGYNDFDLGILLTTNATIKKYNATYRNKNKATDVLSFPFHHIAPGIKINAIPVEP